MINQYVFYVCFTRIELNRRAGMPVPMQWMTKSDLKHLLFCKIVGVYD